MGRVDEGMTEQDAIPRIKAELEAIKAEESTFNFKYNHTYHFGMVTFSLLDDMERARKRRVELEEALRILEEFG